MDVALLATTFCTSADYAVSGHGVHNYCLPGEPRPFTVDFLVKGSAMPD